MAAPAAPTASRAAAPEDTGWHVARLLSAPHRLGFFAAALLMAATALWWLAAIAARTAGVALPWAFAIQFAGLLAERWYFFAEANHPQNLYYGVIA